MTEEVEAVEPEEAPEQQEVAEQEPDSAAVEQEARSMGWVPKEQFRGNETEWRDADEFVRRGKEILPIVNSKLRRVQAEKDELANHVITLQKQFDERASRIERMGHVALQRQKEQLFDHFAKQKEEAVERGDIDRYRQLEAEEIETFSNYDRPDYVEQINQQLPKDPRDAVPPNWRKAIEGWLPDNEWFHDQELGSVAAAAHERLRKEQPGLTPQENLAAVKDYVAGRYPEKFGRQKGSTFSRVEGGSRGGVPSNSAYSKLPSEAKKVCNSQVDLFLEKGETAERDGAKAKERWAKVYFDSGA